MQEPCTDNRQAFLERNWREPDAKRRFTFTTQLFNNQTTTLSGRLVLDASGKTYLGLWETNQVEGSYIFTGKLRETQMGMQFHADGDIPGAEYRKDGAIYVQKIRIHKPGTQGECEGTVTFIQHPYGREKLTPPTTEQTVFTIQKLFPAKIQPS